MKRFLLAIQFLTIFPVRVKGEVTGQDMLGSAVFFPIAGLTQGLFLLGSGVFLVYLFPPVLSAALVILLLVVTNGGFHLDGLADTADGLACKGDTQKRLEVMRDGATGPVGATAIVFSLLIKYAALVGIIQSGIWPFAMAVVFMPALSKWVMLINMRIGRPARKEGLGAIFISKVGTQVPIATGLLILVLMTITVMLAGWSCLPVWHVFGPIAMLVLFVSMIIFNRVVQGAMGGQTGDTLGASGEVSEVIYLLMVAAWSNHFIS